QADVRVGPIRPQSESFAKQALGLGLVLGSRPRQVLERALDVRLGIQRGIVAGPGQGAARRNDQAGNQRPDDEEGGAGPGAMWQGRRAARDAAQARCAVAPLKRWRSR
ncbi:MAG TPA: hypothetical protein VKF61_09185, partial [Candidatus Polarisedimenticolia bacterium]|nr:hypothetical protein [Candidatus Polarisedimenticolia bacterium]